MPPRNGFANVKNSAKPIPIMATASTSAATMNIFVCSIGVSSGWRAAPSRKRPPRIPKPMAVPRAPRPKMMPTASTVMLWMCAMFSTSTSPGRNRSEQKNESDRGSVVLVRHRQVDDGQHHENERLQRDHEDVEDGPRETEHQVRDHAEPAAQARELREPVEGEQREQQEDHFTGEQVAEESQGQRDGARDERHDLE